MNKIRSNDTFNPHYFDSLSHPQADRIHPLLTRDGRYEIDEILIDDEEGIQQALISGIELLAGYHEEVMNAATELVKIYLNSQVESLNVSAATIVYSSYI